MQKRALGIALSVFVLLGAGMLFALSQGGSFSFLFGSVGNSAAVLSGGSFAGSAGSAGYAAAAPGMTGGSFASDTGSSLAVTKIENNLSRVHPYPNPFKPNSGLGHTVITFSRLTDHTALKIFTLAGELVYSAEADTPSGELAWNVTNDGGDTVASGVYLYLITNPQGEKKTGKLAIIR